MARTTAPLLSFEAAGQIAKTQVYSKWKGRSYVRRYTVPSNPKSLEQTKTRSLFKWLSDVWRYMPAAATSAWKLYANNLQITDRNAFNHVNLGPMRGDTTTVHFLASPSANGGIAAAGISTAAGSGQISVTLTAPSLPTGWTIVAAHAIALKEQDPQTTTPGAVGYGTDATSPYVCVITGLTASTLYRVGGWFEYLRADGSPAFGQALMTTATPT